MFGTRIAVKRGGRDEAEKPFWISFADLMTALMVLFLVVMGVALLAVTKNVTEKEKREEQHRKDIELILDRFQNAAKRYDGIKIDRERHVIDFGDRARFAFGKSSLAPEQEAVLRQFVPEILTLANDDLGKRVFKRVVVEGYTDRTGTYLSNLNLSLQRSERVLCSMFATAGASLLDDKQRWPCETCSWLADILSMARRKPTRKVVASRCASSSWVLVRTGLQPRHNREALATAHCDERT